MLAGGSGDALWPLSRKNYPKQFIYIREGRSLFQEAIARNLMEMSTLEVPVIAFIIGEGGSGGALALAVANKVYMLENSVYSILSPEGFASILWKDSTRAK